MTIDEKEFRAFIANLRLYLSNCTYDEEQESSIDMNTYYILENKLMNSLIEYEKLLNKDEKKSRWKQLKIEKL